MVARINKPIINTSNEEVYLSLLGYWIKEESLNQTANHGGQHFPNAVYINNYKPYDKPDIQCGVIINIDNTNYNGKSIGQREATTEYNIDCFYRMNVTADDVNDFDSKAITRLQRLTHNVRNILSSTYYNNMLGDKNVKDSKITNITYFQPEKENVGEIVVSRMNFKMEYFEINVDGISQALESINSSLKFGENNEILIVNNTEDN